VADQKRLCLQKTHENPKELDSEKQASFIEEYPELKESLKEGEVIVFLDGTHPQYQSQSAYG